MGAYRKSRWACIFISLSWLFASAAETTAQTADQSDRHRQQWEWFYRQRAYPFDRIPPGARRRAMEYLERAIVTGEMQVAAIPGVQWGQIGPAPIQKSQIPGRGPASGRVTAIATHPSDPNIVYVGAAQGGVWKSVDAGATWSPLTDAQCSLAIGALAIDPQQPNIIYAGTGELNFSADSYYGCGILRSPDGGATWSQLGAAIFDTAQGGARLSKILVHPVMTNYVYAASDFGVYRSTNSGLNWTPQHSGVATDLVMDPLTPATLYLALKGQGIYKSADSGGTWTHLTNGLPATVGRGSLAIAPSAPKTVYAAFQDTSTSGLLGIFKTTDGGDSWSQVSSPPPPAGSSQPCTCWYDMVLSVDPGKPDTVYFGGTPLYRSTDGGAHWSNITAGQSGGGIHVDQHALTFDPSGRLYAGNDGGVWRTADGGAHWTNLNTNLAITQFSPGAGLHPTNSSIAFGGTQDNGTNKWQGSSAWLHVVDGDGGFTAVDFVNPNTVYAETQWGGPKCNACGFMRSDDGGSTFHIKMNGIDRNDPAFFYPPFAMDPSDSQTLIFGTYRLYRTTDKAENWSSISPPFTMDQGVTAVAIAPTSSATIYIGTYYGDVWVTTDTGGNWTDISAGLPTRSVTDIAVDPSDSRIAYVTVSGFGSGHVFRTTSGGTSWTDISSTLPDIPVNAIVVDARSTPFTLFVGTDLGIFVSTDGGASWSVFNNGLPNVAVFDLALNPRTGVLLAPTHGRSVFVLQEPDLVVSSLSNPPVSVPQGGSFTVTDTTANQGTAIAGPSTTRYYLSSGRIVRGPLLTGSRAVPALKPRGSSVGTVTVTVPSTIPLGTYYLGACADDLRVVAELIESNNCRASTTTLQVVPMQTSITVVSPNGGEIWPAGTTQTIRWAYRGTPGAAVKIELLKGGVLQSTITSSTRIGQGGAGSYNWTIPVRQLPGTDYRVRITSTTNPAYTDTSDGYFTIR